MSEYYTSNIGHAFDATSAEDLRQGLEWYDVARTAADKLADGAYSREQAAGVIAALSPMTGWGTNLRTAREIMLVHAENGVEPPTGLGLSRNVAKAWRILNGEDPSDVLSGPKVTAFYANILGAPDIVTVDRWAARIARGDLADSGLVTAREYRDIADAYRAVAWARNTDARHVQAATWVWARKQSGRKTDDPTTEGE